MQVYNNKLKRCIIAITAVGFSFSLSGCGGLDGVDINLPVVGNIMAKKKRQETSLVDRGNLILPPKNLANALPVPGSGAASVNNQAWPTDPELQAKRVAALKKAKIEKERKEGNFKTYSGQEGFDRATDGFERREGIFNKYYRKSKEQ